MPSSQKKTSHTLTLVIDGHRITSDKFRRSINDFLDILDEVTKEFSGTGRNVKWIVSVRPGSAIISLKAESISPRLPPEKVPVLLDVIQTGLQEIERTATRPPYFTDSTLKKARDLASLVDGEIDSIKIKRGEITNSVTAHTMANVGSLFAAAYKDWGSIEGRLSEVSERGQLHVYVYDRVLDKHIRCHVTEDTLDDMAPYWGKRVSVSGLIRYRSNGEIKDINVRSFEVFPPLETLPSFDDVRGIFRGID